MHARERRVAVEPVGERSQDRRGHESHTAVPGADTEHPHGPSGRRGESTERFDQRAFQKSQQGLEAIRHGGLLATLCRPEERVWPPLLAKRWGNNGRLWQLACAHMILMSKARSRAGSMTR